MILLALVGPAAAICAATYDGRYALTDYVVSPTSHQIDSLAVGDLDGDGLDDVLAGTGWSYEGFYVEPFLQRGGALVAGAEVSVPVGGSTTAEMGSVALGDVDEDGDLDALAGTLGGAYLLRNDGRAAFGAPEALGTARYFAVRLLDGDGDGHLDVFGLTHYAVHVAWGDGTGAFAAPTELFATEGTPVALALVDVGGDGVPDLAVSQEGAPGFAVWTGAGGRAFVYTDAWDLEGRWNGGGLGVGDLDGDGLADAVLGAGGTDASLSLFYQGAGGFGPLSTLATHDNPGPLLVGDVDTDGLDDVVVTHGGRGCLGVHLQTTRGLGAEDTYDVPHVSSYDHYGIGVGDLDGDACNDVVLADYENGVLVLPGTGCKDVYKDTDGDAVPDVRDVCDTVYDPGQGDRDLDGLGDVCDGCPNDADDGYDDDADGTPDACDLCPGADDAADLDRDGVPDGCEDEDTGVPADTAADTGGDDSGADTAADTDTAGPVDTADGSPADPEKGAGCGCGTGAPLGAWAAALALLGALARRR